MVWMSRHQPSEGPLSYKSLLLPSAAEMLLGRWGGVVCCFGHVGCMHITVLNSKTGSGSTGFTTTPLRTRPTLTLCSMQGIHYSATGRSPMTLSTGHCLYSFPSLLIQSPWLSLPVYKVAFFVPFTIKWFGYFVCQFKIVYSFFQCIRMSHSRKISSPEAKLLCQCGRTSTSLILKRSLDWAARMRLLALLHTRAIARSLPFSTWRCPSAITCTTAHTLTEGADSIQYVLGCLV